MKVFFVGGASLARMCYNIIRKNGHEAPFVYDHTKGLKPSWDCVLFDDEARIPDYARACEGFLVCIGDTHGEVRVRYSRQLQQLGLLPVSAIHHTAFFGEDSRIGNGLQALPASVVSDFASIGDFCILNANCTLGHDCVVGSGVHIMSSAAMSGFVRVGDFSTIGSNATILPRVRIGTRCIVGAGAVVTKDVPDNAVVLGVPARIVRYREVTDL